MGGGKIMEKLVYNGHKVEIFIPAINRTVKQGEEFPAPKEIAEQLKLQGCFEQVKPEPVEKKKKGE